MTQKRKWQTIVFILLIGLLSFTYVRLNNLFFSPEEVFYACERGLRSGPSEEIIREFAQEDGGLLLVGRQKEGLFVVSVEKHLGIFWRMKSGGVNGLFPVEKEFDGYLMQDGKDIGLCLNPEIRKTDIEPLVMEAVKELVSDKYFAKEIEKRIGVQTDATAIDKELSNYESKLKEADLNKAPLEREIDNLPIDARFIERKIHDMRLKMQS